MKINRDSWHSKLYHWFLPFWFYFKTANNYVPSRFDEKSNLCFYVRALVVWLPLLTILYTTIIAATIFAFIVLPSRLFGFGYLYFWVILAVVVVGAVVYARSWKRAARRKRIESIMKAEQAATKESFSHVVAEWAKAKKASICPIIEFVSGRES